MYQPIYSGPAVFVAAGFLAPGAPVTWLWHDGTEAVRRLIARDA